MTWDKSSQGLVELFAELAPREPGVEERKMFGWPCCFLDGNLFTGLHKESMIFRLPEGDRAEFLGQEGAAEFSPMPGRPMKEYVAAEGPLLRDKTNLAKWIARSLAYARTLPPKAKGKPGKTKPRKKPSRS